MTLLALTTLSGCGQKSVIKDAVQPRSLAEQYGDGKYLYPEPFYPLTEIPEKGSMVPNAGPLLSGIARTFMNIGAALGAGKTNMTMVMPIPEIPREYVKDIRLKRVFFYIEPHSAAERKVGWLRSLIHGKGNVDFDFLSKVGAVLNSYHLDKRTGYTPIFPDEKTMPEAMMSKDLQDRVEGFFKKKTDIFPQYVDPRTAKDILILKYDWQRRKEYLKNDEYGDMFIAMTDKPTATRQFFLNHPSMKGFFKNIYTLDKAIMIELNKDPVISESFNVLLSENRHELDDLKVGMIEQCTPKTCMDLRVPDVSLIDVVTKDNAIKMDVFLEAGSVPETFRLQGFIEFKAQVKSPI